MNQKLKKKHCANTRFGISLDLNWCKYKRWCCCPFVPSFVYPYKKLIANCFHRWPFPFFVCLSVYLQIELNILPQNILFPIKGLDFVLHGKWAHVKRIEVNGDRDSYYISCVYKYINILSNEAKQKERLTHIQEITVHLIYIYKKFYLYFAFMRDNKLEDKIVKGRERERERNENKATTVKCECRKCADNCLSNYPNRVITLLI